MTLWIDAILALVALEALAFALYRRWTLLPTLAAGAALLLAMRLLLAGAAPPWIALALLAAGAAHLTDLMIRWRRSKPSPSGLGPQSGPRPG